jgi:hypothetical protein
MALNNLNRFLEGDHISINGRKIGEVGNALIHEFAYKLHGKDRRNSCRLHMHCNDKDYHNLSKDNWQCLCNECHSAVENYSVNRLKDYIKENRNKCVHLDVKKVYVTH